MSHLEQSYWLTDEIHRRIGNMAYRCCYEGEWRIVQEALERYFQTPKQYYEWFITHFSPEDFFGNIARPAQRLAEFIDFKERDPHGPVRRPQRHRGYKDKGTYVPPHCSHRNLPSEEEIETEDRRPFIGHPLLHEKDPPSDEKLPTRGRD
jgi:hypothetical protein